MDEVLRSFAADQGLRIDGVEGAARRSEEELAEFQGDLAKASPPDSVPNIDVVLTGSFARRELTYKSDCDFLVVVDGTVDPLVVNRLIRQVDQLRRQLDYGKPGGQGIFGDFVTANELLQRIGLDGDSNTNHTRRMLLLNESVSIYRPELRAKIIRQILDRYCLDYDPRHRASAEPFKVPRFLINDVVRYWRTVAVDFGAKQWRTLADDWYLRYAKLLTTRKILFAGVFGSLLRAKFMVPAGDDAHTRLLDYLVAESERSPVSRLASLSEFLDTDGKRALGQVIQHYSEFIDVLDRRDTRSLLSLPDVPEGSKQAKLREEIEGIGEGIQKNLENVFFADGSIGPLTQRYGLF